MPSAPTAQLLADVDPLSYPRRMALLAVRARQLSESGELDRVLDDLGAGDAFQRQTGLLLSVVLRRTDRLRDAMADPDRQISERAVAGWLQLTDARATEVAEFLSDACAQSRQVVYRMVKLKGRPELAEALIGEVRARFGDREAARLLPACGSELVARLLPELAHEVGNWVALARRHPRVVVAEAARQLAELSRPMATAWWRRYGDGVFAAAEAAPDQVLDLLERFAPETFLPADLRRYGVLADFDASRVLGLLTASGRAAWLLRCRLPRALLSRLGRLEPSMLVPLGRRLRVREVSLAALLDAIPPRHRGELFDAAVAGVDRSQAIPPDVLLTVLPRQRRYDEARRLIGLDLLRDDEAAILRYHAFLAWEEAQPVLAAAVRRAQAEDRATGYRLMVECAARTGPAAVTAVVEEFRRLRNEQDPVRSVALAALAKVPPTLLEPGTAEALGAIVSDAMGARDSSAMTLNAVGSLAIAVLRQHFDSPPLLQWALSTLDKVHSDGRLPGLGRLDQRLRRGQEHEVFAAFQSWLQAGVEHGRHEPLFALTDALRRRAWQLPELQAMLGRAVSVHNVTSVVRRAVSLWLADPATRAARVEHVLAVDSSTVTLAPVWEALCRNRTDLLDRVLSGAPPAGKFLAEGVRWVPLRAEAVRRWLPRQQGAYAELLRQLAGDASIALSSRTAAIASAATIPEYGWELVSEYVDSTNTNLAEAALGALPWTEHPDRALPILLQHADGDRARVATYAAGRAALFVAPSRLLADLGAYPLAQGKVTTRKEVVRLLSRLSVPGASTVLESVWRQENQHRDVRAAVVSAARQRLDDPAVWPILTEAASGARADVRPLLEAEPFSVAERFRPRYAQLIARACRSSDTEVARAAWSAYPNWAQWTVDASGQVVARLADLNDRIVWRLVLQAVTALVEAGIGGTVVDDVLVQLIDLDENDPTRDDPQRDRPAWRRIDALVEHLMGWSRHVNPDASGPVLAAAGRRLAQHADFVAQGARLLTRAIPIRPSLAAAALVEVCDLLAQRPVAAAQLAEELADRLDDSDVTAPDAIRQVAQQLLERADPAGGLFAVALSGHGETYGWPQPWRELVLRLRTHPVADVRAAALDLDLAAE